MWGERLRTSAGPFVASVAAFFACARHIELSAAFVKRVDEAVPTEAAAEDAAARADGSEKRDGKMGGPANRGFSVF